VGAERVAFATDSPFNPSHDELGVRRSLESIGLDEHSLSMVSSGSLMKFLEI
jgi:hypothetical protein